MRCSRLLSITLLLASTVLPGRAFAEANPLQKWVQTQAKIVSLRGKFSQERKLKALRKPLVAPGRFYYEAPDQFRWEVGEPAKSVTIHSREQYTVIDLEKGKAEVQDITEGDDNSRMVSYFRLSFPRDWAAFQRDFRVLEVTQSEGVLRAELEPLNRSNARGVKTITFEIDPATYATLAFVLELKDGSEMRTRFSGVQRNEPLPASIFQPELNGLRIKEK